MNDDEDGAASTNNNKVTYCVVELEKSVDVFRNDWLESPDDDRDPRLELAIPSPEAFREFGCETMLQALECAQCVPSDAWPRLEVVALLSDELESIAAALEALSQAKLDRPKLPSTRWSGEGQDKEPQEPLVVVQNKNSEAPVPPAQRSPYDMRNTTKKKNVSPEKKKTPEKKKNPVFISY